MARERPDPGALLCERCGYPLDAVRGEIACPECGARIACSLPGARTGSAWQRGPSLGAWLVTAAELVRWRQLFDRVRIGRHDADWLLRVNLAIASVLLAGALAEPDVDQLFLGAQGALAKVLGGMLVLTPAAYVTLRVLTAIERVGLRFFGNRRGGRVTPEIARSVTAHASYGWVASGLLAAVLAALGHLVFRRWYNDVGAGWVLTAPGAHVLFAVAGFFVGLLLFETLSYLGSLRCRFANPPAAGGESVNEPVPNPEPSVHDYADDPDSADDVPPPTDPPDRAGR